MFGYINVNKNDLSEEDAFIYKSFYCGVCRALKDIGGSRTTVCLNYDVVFLALVLSGLYEPQENSFEFTCKLHPGKKRTAFKNDILDYAAKIDILLSYQSLMDDYHDEGDKTKKVFADSLKKYYDDIAVKLNEQVKAIENCIRLTSEAEKNNEKNLDVVAGYTGDMLSVIFAYGDDLWKDDLSTLGYYLGKYIYILDSFVDLEKDLKKKNYNPLINIETKEPSEYESYVRQALTMNISEAAKAFERLPILKYSSIIRNILYSGVWNYYDVYHAKHMKNNKDE